MDRMSLPSCRKSSVPWQGRRSIKLDCMMQRKEAQFGDPNETFWREEMPPWSVSLFDGHSPLPQHPSTAPPLSSGTYKGRISNEKQIFGWWKNMGEQMILNAVQISNLWLKKNSSFKTK